MKYAKPTIGIVATAIHAIQNHCDKSSSHSDNCGTPANQATATAYEADE
jgi:hypothetical protein